MKHASSKFAFVVLFSAISAIALQINFSKVLGAENQYFTLFQFLGPIAGGFLGPILGAVVALFSQVIGFLVAGKEPTLLNMFRLAPMLFAAYYFGTKNRKFDFIIPLLALTLWFAHPIGREAWLTSAFFLIPLAISLRFKDRLFAKSIGATFTAYTIGTVFWLYTIPSTAAFWWALIPVTITERLLFAAGISVSYVGFMSVLAQFSLPSFVKVDYRYTLTNLLKA